MSASHRLQLAPIAALLMTTSVFLMGSALLNTLVPVTAQAAGFSTTLLGLLGSAYFGGFVIGSLIVRFVLRRAGHIRTFGVFAVLSAIAILVSSVALDPVVWIAARLVFGAALAGLFVTIESWINHQATNENRGAVVSVYIVVNLSAVMLGQGLFALMGQSPQLAFAVGVCLLLAAFLPVALTLQPQPAQVAEVHLRLMRLYRLSPVGVAGNVVVGFINGPFWALAPAFVAALGYGAQGVAAFIAAAIFGAGVSQFPLGRLSDRMDRRIVIFGASLASIAAGGLLVAAALVPTDFVWRDGLVFGAAFVFGATAFPIGALATAHLNDHVPREELTEAMGGVFLIYGAAAAIAPALAAPLIDLFGMAALFVWTAAFHLLFAGFTLVRMRLRAGIPASGRPDLAPQPIGATGLPAADAPTPEINPAQGMGDAGADAPRDAA